MEHKNMTIEIHQEEYVESPREEWDHLGKMWFFHRRYNLGDKDNPINTGDFHSWDEIWDYIEEEYNPAVIAPISMLDHSGLYIYKGTGAHWCDPGGWDSGMIGYALITKADARKEYGWKRISKKRVAKLQEHLDAEIEEYKKYLESDVWYYLIKDPYGEVVDSCGWIYGYDEAERIAKEQAELLNEEVQAELDTLADAPIGPYVMAVS